MHICMFFEFSCLLSASSSVPNRSSDAVSSSSDPCRFLHEQRELLLEQTVSLHTFEADDDVEVLVAKGDELADVALTSAAADLDDVEVHNSDEYQHPQASTSGLNASAGANAATTATSSTPSRSIAFESLFPPSRVSRQVVARAFSHILSLASKSVIKVIQQQHYDGMHTPITLVFV